MNGPVGRNLSKVNALNSCRAGLISKEHNAPREIAVSGMRMMTGKIPNANPQHYLLRRAAGRAALKKLSSNYPDPVKWIHQEQELNDRTVSKGDYPI